MIEKENNTNAKNRQKNNESALHKGMCWNNFEYTINSIFFSLKASEKGDKKIVEYLLSYWADVTNKDKIGRTALIPVK